MISEVAINQKFKSLVPFIWNRVPKFAIICGINGSGKTQLLEAINDAVNLPGNQSAHAKIKATHSIRGKIQYVPANHQFGTLNNNHGTTNQIETRINSIIQYAKTQQNKNNAQYNELIKEIEKVSSKSISELSAEEIEKRIPPNYMWYLENGFNNQYISELFKAYQSKVDSIRLDHLEKDEKISFDEAYEKIGFPPPWIAINEIFDRYDFSYHIQVPKGRNLQYVPRFIDKSDPRNEIDFNDLSSGEKIIVSLILWSFNQKIGEKNTVFLLDEFDAHLNPLMSRMFIEIVKDKLVAEYGLQVLMTSHSPSTVAFANEDDIYWMERGRAIDKKSKHEIVTILSDGVMTYAEASTLLLALTKSSKSLFLFTEGITDIEHLKVAQNKLASQLDCEMYTCNGANKLKQFLIGCPESLFQGKKIVGLFDYDSEGLNCINSIIKETNFYHLADGIYRSKSNNSVYAMFLPVPDESFIKYKYCPIEFLYERSILDSYQLLEKRNLKDINHINESSSQINSADYEQMSNLWFYRVTESKTSKEVFSKSVQNLDVSKFANFKPLLDVLDKISNIF